MRSVGYLYQKRRDYPEALRWLEQTAPSCKESGQPMCEALGLEGQGTVYQSWGKYPQAEAAFQKSLQVLAALEYPAERSRIENRLAACYTEQGRAGDAVRLYEADLQWIKAHA